MTSRRERRARRSAPVQPQTTAVVARSGVHVAPALVLALFAVTFAALAVASYRRTSATWDEPIHVTAGYAALTKQDFSVDPSHPPLLRMWAALPALLMDAVSMDAPPADRVAGTAWLQDAYLFAHDFLYIDNDADRILYAARFMTVLLGVLLGVFLFRWAHEWLGLAPAIVSLVLFTVEPNLLAHSSLVTTDLGVTCFMFGSVYFAWRTCRDATWRNVVGLTVCFSLAILSKFSAVLLVPVVAVLLALTVAQRHLTMRRALAIVGVLALTAFAALWASYGFQYLPTAAPGWAFNLHQTDLARQAPALASLVGWIDANRLLPNAFTQGLFYTQTSVQQMPAYLAGSYSTEGWWYYFPAAFLVKTPLVLLVLMIAGVIACVRRRATLGAGNLAFLWVPIVVYLTVAMTSGINIGLRHVLPIFPFAILIAAAGALELLRRTRQYAPAAIAALAIAATAELATAYPHPLTFFNQTVGGPSNGYKYLADSNLGWGQGLKPLGDWMSRNAVDHVNLAYFGQADPAYYGINVTHLPGAPTFAADATARPTLPGYVAISATTLTGVYAPPWWRLFYKPFQELEPVAVLGNSLRVYWVERWPEALGPRAGDDIEAHRSLADALLLGYAWPTRAALHYREYLQHHPDDADALVNYGIALVGADRVEEGLAALRRAVAANGNHGAARLTLGKALFGSRDLAGAAEHAERAVALLPDDADAHHLLGRVRAVQGRLDDAAREFERVLQLQPQHAEAREYLRRIAETMRSRVRPAVARAAIE
jgi:tetratricopeptide (TPR) repeat protein